VNTENLRLALAALERGESFAWVTVITVEGSSPGQPGQKMIVYADGRQDGTVGGGALEQRAAQEARALLAQGRGGILQYQLDADSPGGIGALCGGKATLSVEVFPPTVHILLCGAGHLSLALARQCGELGFAHTVADARPDLATAERFPRARALHREAPAGFIRHSGLDPYTHVVILTHNHEVDSAALEAVWEARYPRYVGMIGSRRKWDEVRAALTAQGVERSWLETVHCPIGLAIGARTPAEIAVAIAAEILQELPTAKK
jgi:xanthine dehydrogenase accessory factor